MACQGPEKSDATQLQVLSRAVNHLGIHLYKKLAIEKDNIFISPLSLSSALAIAFCGARKETALEMQEVLGYNVANIKDDEVKNCFQLMFSSLNEEKKSYTLNCANVVFGQRNFHINEDYKTLLADYFQAMLQGVDFLCESEKAVHQVNNWVKEKTNGMITKLVEKLEPSTVVVILNAVYFKGFWKHSFEEDATYKQNFYNEGLEDNVKEVDMMHLKNSFPFTQNESYSAIQLPYIGDEVAMVILLPSARNGLEALEHKLSSDFLKELKINLRKTKVKLALPKFRLEYSKSMKEYFQSMGMNLAFSEGAHFDGMSDSDGLFISQIIHKAVVIVNEEGSEAAAVTGITMMAKCLTFDPEFTADHPFLFLIYNTKTDLILFLGKIKSL